jgi:SAM-dependent methyltransferase
VKLNLGCGRRPLAGWVNVDREALPGVDVVFDLETCAATPLPFEDDSFDEIAGIDLIEHVVNVLPLMAELWRVAKPGAVCRFALPYGSHDSAWEDPTHVRPYFVNSWSYFGQPNYFRADYGYRGDWRVDRVVLEVDVDGAPSEDEVMSMVMALRNVVVRQEVLLSAVKPARACDAGLRESAPVELRRRCV